MKNFIAITTEVSIKFTLYMLLSVSMAKLIFSIKDGAPSEEKFGWLMLTVIGLVAAIGSSL
jgi:hypothetical protein